MTSTNLSAQSDSRVTRATLDWRKAALAALIFTGLWLAGSARAEPRLTQKCNTNWSQSVAFRLPADSALLSTIMDAVKRPESNPDLFEKLWRPLLIGQREMYSFDNGIASLSLYYPVSLDVQEIGEAIKQEGILPPEFNVLSTSPGILCFAALPLLPPVILTEYYNSGLDHYALAVGPNEVAFVDSGQWGEGWVRSGETIAATSASYCHGTRYVQRFASLRDKWPPSLYYTVKPEVCGFLRNHNAGWRYLADAFGARAPENGVCVNSLPVYQLYNNRPDVNQANHRYTTKLALYNSMQAKGWVGEGVAFCI